MIFLNQQKAERHCADVAALKDITQMLTVKDLKENDHMSGGSIEASNRKYWA